MESVGMLISVVFMGLARKNFRFKEVFIFYLGLITTMIYLIFVKGKGRTDLFDILFPQMNIWQIKECLFSNFYLIVSFIESYLISVPSQLR